MNTWIRTDGQTTRTLIRRQVGRSQAVIEWLPPRLYGRFHLFYGHDVNAGDRAITLTIGRLEFGWYR